MVLHSWSARSRHGNALVERAHSEEGDDERQQAKTFDHGRRDDHHRLQRAGRLRLPSRAIERRASAASDAQRAAKKADARAESDADITESEIQHCASNVFLSDETKRSAGCDLAL